MANETELSNNECRDVSPESNETCLDVRNLSKEQTLSLIIECANFAAKKHRTQRRKDADSTPYINHPLGVAHILTEEGNIYDPVVLLAAILHDTVEDTDTTFEELENQFGHKVCSVVKEVTDDKTLPKAERKRLQIEHAPGLSYEAKLVKLADKLYNLRDIIRVLPIGWTYERAREYFKWARAVIQGCRGTNLNLERQLDIAFANWEKQSNESCKGEESSVSC